MPTLWENETITAAGLAIPAGEPVDLLVSDPLNGNNVNSLRVTLQYDDVTPDTGGASFSIGAVVETPAAGGWTPIASQFSPFRTSRTATTREIVMQPDISDFNAGIDDIVYPVDRELARISRSQGQLPSDYRIRVLLVDNDPGGPSSFQSVKISASVDTYNV